jgi:NodT family efflux transporter outer membrane factor (OMF) lipoprotein
MKPAADGSARRRNWLAIRFMLMSGCAALTGCVVGPNYRAPTPPTGAEAPLSSVRPDAEQLAPPPDDWWRLYDDPLLDRYVSEAFEANFDLKSAEANLSAARATLQVSQAANYPSTQAVATGVYGRDITTDEILETVHRPPQTTWLFETVFDLSYELDLFGRVRRSIEGSKADTEAAEASRDDVRVTIAAETVRAYAQLCALGEQLDVARRSLAVVSREAQITARRQDAGAAPELDIVRTQGIVAQVGASIPQLEGQRRATLFELTALLGRTPARAPLEAEACVAPPRLREFIPVGDGAALLRRRPDVRLADRRLASATAGVGVAVADLYPRVTLTGSYGGAAPDLADLTRNIGLTWGVGPKISWDFPNQMATRARIRQAKAGAEAALDNFNSTVLQALKETEQTLTTYGAELDHHQALGEAQDRARQALKIADDQYQAGSLASLDLVTAEQSLVTADSAVADSDAALVEDQIAVFKALGGGWKSADSSQTRQ